MNCLRRCSYFEQGHNDVSGCYSRRAISAVTNNPTRKGQKTCRLSNRKKYGIRYSEASGSADWLAKVCRGYKAGQRGTIQRPLSCQPRAEQT